MLFPMIRACWDFEKIAVITLRNIYVDNINDDVNSWENKKRNSKDLMKENR